MWELAKAAVGRAGEVEDYLKEGYEPFAITSDAYVGEIVWLKREVKDEVCKQRPELVEGAGGGTPNESTTEESS